MSAPVFEPLPPAIISEPSMSLFPRNVTPPVPVDAEVNVEPFAIIRLFMLLELFLEVNEAPSVIVKLPPETRWVEVTSPVTWSVFPLSSTLATVPPPTVIVALLPVTPLISLPIARFSNETFLSSVQTIPVTVVSPENAVPSA